MIYNARQSVSIVDKIVTFVMHLGGDDVAIKGGVYIHVTVDFINATLIQLMDCSASAQGLRVKLQGILRKLPVDKLRELESGGYKCKFVDIWGVRQPVTRVITIKTLKEAIEFYTNVEEFVSAIKTLDWGTLINETTLRTVHKKHYSK